MLKLIRYDFRRSRDLILALLLIMVILNGVIWRTYQAMNKELFSLHALLYFAAVISVAVIAAVTYNRNLKSYNRRLLPVKSLQAVLSPLLFCWMLLLAILMIAALHLGIYVLLYSDDFLPGNFWPVVIKSVLLGTWSAGFMLILGMFSITVARILWVKGRAWIGIAAFVVVQNAVSYLEKWLFNSYFVGINNTFNFEVIEAADLKSGISVVYSGTGLWPIIFELVLAVILVYVMSVMVKRRIEV